MPSINSLLSLDNYNPMSVGRVTNTPCPAVKAKALKEMASIKRSLELLDFETKKFEIKPAPKVVAKSGTEPNTGARPFFKDGDKVRVIDPEGSSGIWEGLTGTVVYGGADLITVSFDAPWGMGKRNPTSKTGKFYAYRFEKIEKASPEPANYTNLKIGSRVVLIDEEYMRRLHPRYAELIRAGSKGTVLGLDSEFVYVKWDGVTTLNGSAFTTDIFIGRLGLDPDFAR